MSIKRAIPLRPGVSAFLFLFQVFADLRHRQGMLRRHSTMHKIKAMKVIRIIGIHNREMSFQMWRLSRYMKFASHVTLSVPIFSQYKAISTH